MRTLNKRQIVFELIQDFLVSFSLTITALLVSKISLSPSLIIKETCFAWIVNLLIGFTVPEKELGELICKKLKLKNPVSYFLIMLVIVVINVIGISMCVVLKNVGLQRIYFKVWLGLLPPLLLIGYPAAIIFSKITGAVVERIFE